MPFIDELGIGVTINVNGTPAPEYSDPEEAELPGIDPALTQVRQVYIESVDDAHFSIRWDADERQTWIWEEVNNALYFESQVDDIEPLGSLCFQSDFEQHLGNQEASHEVDGITAYVERSRLTSLRRFQFASISTLDEADKTRVQEDAERVSKLGFIRVNVWRERNRGPAEDGDRSFPKAPADFSLAEKALKGKSVSHGTSLSSPVPVEKDDFYETDEVDEYPFAVFIFRYRSRDALKEEMIIPRSPSPSPPPMPNPLDNMSPKEIRRLAEERLAQIKKEGVEPRNPIKREFTEIFDLTEDTPHPRPVKIYKRDKGKETVDLTDD